MKKTTKKAEPTKAESNPSEVVSGDDLSTIREILFGQQHRGHNQRQEELEALIKSSVMDLKQDTKQQFKELNKKVDELTNALSKRLDKELANEAKTRDKATALINDHIAEVEQVMSNLDDSTSAADNDLQDQLLNQADVMQKQMDELYNEVTSALKKEVTRLSNDKADRTSLASLLNGIASQLSESGSGAGMTSN
ncbi:MAG: hypothetical protein CL693_02450 [Cellvibrionaceae bacterium]|nr:hypothetical protein [Cellvibrionaceae bacterium]|tara:strand:- start:29824 stop:30408 length:585 start_codon:yes stop_codon:yes gene_type:complete